MAITMEDYDRIAYDKARRKVKEIKGFYINLVCYILAIPLLVYINLTYSPQFQWFWFSAAGWGVGLICHAMGAFSYYPFLGRNWEDKKLQEIMDRMAKEEQKTKFE